MSAATPIVRSTILEAASEDDRRWFEQHVGRQHRIREPIGGEVVLLPALLPGRRWVVVVKQIKPGVRIKASLEWIGAMPLNAEDLAIELLEMARSSERFRKVESALLELPR